MTYTVAIVGAGDMGSAVGAAFARRGLRVVTDLSGRSAHSRALAAEAGMEDLGSLTALIEDADFFLSILPPAAASSFAGRVAEAMAHSRARPLFVDCNAVAPATVVAISALFTPLDAPFLDAGIVGPAPREGAAYPTRFYVSGPGAARLQALAVPELAFVDVGLEVGRASAIKMCYAALNKGVDALYTAVLLAAERLGVGAVLMEELAASQPEATARMAARVPYLAATAGRYAGEMREIAATFKAAGVTPGFHRGAEWVYDALARTPLAAETRATLPSHRSLDEALAVYCAALGEDGPPRE